MNVVIYARYSDSKQREESIEGQIKVCTEYAEREGYIIINQYIDRAYSAKTDSRPNFQRMIRDSAKKNFEGILVYQLDRFARNRYDSTHYKHILKKNGVQVISAKEAIGDTPDSILLESMLEGLAEYYSAELSLKVIRGMKLNAEKGLSNGGTSPLGYKIENGKYVIDEKTAPIVKEIFTKYANGYSIKSICDSLNERKIKTAKGAEFNKSSLHVMLKNKKYLGIYPYAGVEYPGRIPQIIDNELFEKVAIIMKANKHAPARSKADEEYILSGKLFCGYCKEKMIGSSVNKTKELKYRYYKCKNSGRTKPCKKKMVDKHKIEDIVVKECNKILTPKNIQRIAKELMKIVLCMDDKTELKNLEKLIKKAIEEKENQMLSLRVCKNDTIREMIFEDLEKISLEIQELEKQYEIEKFRHHIVTEKQIIDHLSKLANGNIHDITYRKALIKMLVNKIYLYDDKFTITFNSTDEEVTITDKLFDKIEKSFSGEKVCLLNSSVHQILKTVTNCNRLFLRLVCLFFNRTNRDTIS